MTTNHQIYILGQIYGYICHAHPHWSGVHNAYTKPMTACTIAYMTAIKAGKVKPDDEYISARFNEIDPELEIPNTNELQSVFTLGTLQYNRDIQRVISATGLTQEEIANKIGVTRLTVGRWYRGDVKCPADKRFEIELLAWQEDNVVQHERRAEA